MHHSSLSITPHATRLLIPYPLKTLPYSRVGLGILLILHLTLARTPLMRIQLILPEPS
jgi:hypothetical protein